MDNWNWYIGLWNSIYKFIMSELNSHYYFPTKKHLPCKLQDRYTQVFSNILLSAFYLLFMIYDTSSLKVNNKRKIVLQKDL